MLSQQLIENALALCGKTMDYISVTEVDGTNLETFPAIEKFGWYLLSKPFLREYEPYYGIQFKDSMRHRVGYAFQEAITAYQDGNEELLVDLLEKLV